MITVEINGCLVSASVESMGRILQGSHTYAEAWVDCVRYAGEAAQITKIIGV